MEKARLKEYKGILESFLSDYETYVASYVNYREDYTCSDLRKILQRQLRLVVDIVAAVHGGCSLRLSDAATLNFEQALSCVLTTNFSSDKSRHFIELNVSGVLNGAIGNIVNNTIPTLQIIPVIPIKDVDLQKRCLDLLDASGNFDRVINQATQVLEERLRMRLPFEKLCQIIPETKNQIGEALAHKLLAPPNPVIIISGKPEECSAFHKMVVGIIAYLRNPTHHSLNDDTEKALAWSVVGIVDSLLSEIANAYISSDEPKSENGK
ncbi:MAG: TIGR02391 family protein [Chloroflexota bacterium]